MPPIYHPSFPPIPKTGTSQNGTTAVLNLSSNGLINTGGRLEEVLETAPDSAVEQLTVHSPLPRGSEKLQAYRELVPIRRYAINHPRSRPKTSQQRPHIQTIIGLPRFSRQYSRAPRTHVHRDTLLRGHPDVDARHIDRHLHRSAIFHSLGGRVWRYRYGAHGLTGNNSRF
jgi:hypothetical protein